MGFLDRRASLPFQRQAGSIPCWLRPSMHSSLLSCSAQIGITKRLPAGGKVRPQHTATDRRMPLPRMLTLKGDGFYRALMWGTPQHCQRGGSSAREPMVPFVTGFVVWGFET